MSFVLLVGPIRVEGEYFFLKMSCLCAKLLEKHCNLDNTSWLGISIQMLEFFTNLLQNNGFTSKSKEYNNK